MAIDWNKLLSEKIVIIRTDNEAEVEYIDKQNGVGIRASGRKKQGLIERKMHEAGITEQELLLLLDKVKQRRIEHRG